MLCLFSGSCDRLSWEGLTSWLSVCLVFCVFVIFPYNVLGQVWDLIVSIPYLWLLPYFQSNQNVIFQDISIICALML